MMFGFVGLAVLTGLVSGAGALIMGLGALTAVGIYAGTGILVLLGLLAQAMLETMQEGRSAAVQGRAIVPGRSDRPL